MYEEEDNEIIENIESNYMKLNNNIIDSISFSAINDDSSTYMGVKSVAESQSIIIKETTGKKSKETQNKNNNGNKKKKEESFSSFSETNEEQYEEKRNSFTELLNQKTKEKEKKEKKEKKNEEKEIFNIKNNENKKHTKKKQKIEEIDTKFEWDGSGKLVFVTGSFCDWKKFYIMTKNNEGVFSLTLSLPRGFHQYKFIVDDNWTYSKTLPKYEDNGNVNNFIDTTDYNNFSNEDESENEIELEKSDSNDSTKYNESSNNIDKSKKNCNHKEKENKPNKKQKGKKSNKKKSEEKKNIEKSKIQKQKKRNSSILSVNFLNSQNYYTIYYPLRSEFNKKPLSLPGLYKTCFILNEDHKQKEERKFSEIEYINNSRSYSSISTSDKTCHSSQNINNKIPIIGEVIPHVKFQNLYHIHSNHLHSKMFCNYINTIKISMTCRYRFKLSTFIYYNPNKEVEPVERIRHSNTVKMSFKK